MYLKHYPIDKLKSELLAIVSKHVTIPFKLFFFGSRMKNSQVDDHADIDVGYEAEEPIQLSTLRAIKEEIEEIRILYKIDFVDFADTTEDFKKVAKQHIEYIA